MTLTISKRKLCVRDAFYVMIDKFHGCLSTYEGKDYVLVVFILRKDWKQSYEGIQAKRSGNFSSAMVCKS